MPAPDQAVLSQPRFAERFNQTIREALHSGTRGAQRDTALLSEPWNFEPRDSVPKIHLWHGEADCNAPIAMGRYMAAALPHGEPCFFPGEGHLSLISKRLGEFLGVLVA